MNTRIFWCLLCWLAAAGFSVHAQTAGGEAGDQYLKGYQLKNEGEQLEKAGRPDAALNRYEQALEIISGVARNYPTWQPDVLQFRLQWLQKRIEQLKTRTTAPVPAPAPRAPAPSATLPIGPSAPTATTPYPAPANGSSDPEALWANLRRQMEEKDAQIQRDQVEIGKLSTTNQALQEAYTAQVGRTQRAEQDIRSLGMQNQDLQKQAASFQAALNNAKTSADAEAKAKVAALTEQLQQVLGEKKIVEGIINEKNAALTDLKKSLEEMKKALADSAKREETLTTANQKLQSKVDFMEKGKGSPDGLDQLLAENTRLKAELEAAKKQMDELKANGTKKDAEIAQLKTQLTSIQGELAHLQNQNTEYQKKVADLTVRLKEMDAGLRSKGGPKGSKSARLAEENKTLRSIITRQLRNQERQRQAKEMVISEMERLKNTSQTLIQNLEELTSTRIMITMEEESLFTQPEVDLIYSFESGGGNRATLLTQSSNSGNPAMPSPALQSPAVYNAMTERLKTEAAADLKNHDFKAAQAAYQDVLRADPRNVEVRTSLGALELQLKNFPQAEVELKKALVYDPDNSLAYYELGVCYYSEGQINDARQSFEQSLKRADNARAHDYLGIIAGRISKRNDAEKEFQQALAVDPNYANAHFNLAYLYATSQPPDWERAKQHYQKALSNGYPQDKSMEKLLRGQAGAAPDPAKPAAPAPAPLTKTSAAVSSN